MKIIKENSEGLFLTDTPKAPRFRRFEAAFGWMEKGAKETRKSVHCLMVGGEEEDGRMVILEEWIGSSLYDVTQKAIDVKDRLWLPRIYCDFRERDYVFQLRKEAWADGLTRYAEVGADMVGRMVYEEKHPEERWPNFVSHDTICSLVPVPDFVIVDLVAGLGRVFSLVKSHELRVHSSCSELLWAMEFKTPAEIVDHPVIPATVMLVWALLSKRQKQEKGVVEKRDVSYGNLERG